MGLRLPSLASEDELNAHAGLDGTRRLRYELVKRVACVLVWVELVEQVEHLVPVLVVGDPADQEGGRAQLGDRNRLVRAAAAKASIELAGVVPARFDPSLWVSGRRIGQRSQARGRATHES